MEYSNGHKDRNIEEIGKMENSMEREKFIILKKSKLKNICGKMEKELHRIFFLIFIYH
jgi:hypothetical protein